MAAIHLTTFIKAPPQVVFDVSRSIDVHQASMKKHNEKAVAGVLNGLMNSGDTVTWQARHLFKNRFLQVAITAMDAPHSFTDEMVSGDFKSMKHQHFFKPVNNGTVMTDAFYFSSPYGVLGRLVNVLFLTAYMRRLLLDRNKEIKNTAENLSVRITN